VRLCDIAESAGVSIATVSLAMRNDANISLKTRERIQKLAAQLGYHPNPLVSILMRQLRTSRLPCAPLTLAMVIPFSSKEHWQIYLSPDLIKAATACADRQGYRIEEFWMGDLGMTSQRLSNVLCNRGITGMLVAPLPVANGHLNMDWPRFSAVAVGESLAQPELNRVSINRFRAMRMAVGKLRSLGYERLGLAILAEQDTRGVGHEWTAAFEWEERHSTAMQKTRVFLTKQDNWKEPVFDRWFKAERPQAILGSDPSIISWLKNLGQRVPEDVGFVHLWTPDQTGQYAGIYHNPPAFGIAAVNLLIGMMQRNERGVPEEPQTLLLNGIWVNGATLASSTGVCEQQESQLK
jgi:DNA-binding LacI/PurR family transcriptional regulator